MSKKERVKRLIEFYMNDYRKNELKLYYGEGSKIKINTVDLVDNGKCFLVDMKIVLGEIISEEVLERAFADYLLKESIETMFGRDFTIRSIVGWDS